VWRRGDSDVDSDRIVPQVLDDERGVVRPPEPHVERLGRQPSLTIALQLDVTRSGETEDPGVFRVAIDHDDLAHADVREERQLLVRLVVSPGYAYSVVEARGCRPATRRNARLGALSHQRLLRGAPGLEPLPVGLHAERMVRRQIDALLRVVLQIEEPRPDRPELVHELPAAVSQSDEAQ
jgi:hypothetical protein